MIVIVIMFLESFPYVKNDFRCLCLWSVFVNT